MVGGVCVGLAASATSETGVFSAEQTKDRNGRGSFPHDQKEHQKIQCADCHLAAKEKPKNTDQPMAKDFPHAACIRCHNFASEFFKAAFGQPSRFCGVCHEARRVSRTDKALRAGAFPRPQISDFDDAFSHKAHRMALPPDLRIVPVSNPPYGSQFRAGESPRCTDCHEQMKMAMQPTAREIEANREARVIQAIPIWSRDVRTEKGHATCFVCHGGAPPEPRKVSVEIFPYERDCKVCHELHLSDMPRAQSLFGTVKGFRHDDHDIDIRPKKRSDFPLPTAPDRLCSECHKPIEQVEKLNAIKAPLARYCDTCHISGRPGLPDRLSENAVKKLGGD